MTKRQVLFVMAKLVFAAAVIVWLLQKVDAARVWASVREAHRGPILLGIVLCLLTVLIAGWRWHRLLRAIGITIPVRSLTYIAQIGQFFTVFLPGPTGDDLTRMLYISRIAKGRVGEACTTVLLDRCIGLASVLGLALLCIPWQWDLLATSRTTYWLACGMVATGAMVGGGGMIFFALDRVRLERMRNSMLGLLPEGKLRRQFSRMGELLVLNRRAVAQVIAAAVGTQLLLCVLYGLAGRAVGIALPMGVWLSFVPIVLAANAVPITIAGLGVRESLMVLFLGVVGQVEQEQALAASLVVLGMTLTVCLFGGVVYVFYRPQEGAD